MSEEESQKNLFTDDSQICGDTSSSKKRSRKQSESWPKELANELVQLVEGHEQLWNSFNVHYKNFKASRLLWNEIAKKLGRSGDDCSNKWAAMRSNFKVKTKINNILLSFI